MALFVLPMAKDAGWSELRFSKIPPNQMDYKESGIEVQVDKSAGPLLFKLQEVKNVKLIRVEFEVDGKINSSNTNSFEEDSYLRFGLVATGDRKISKLQLLFAPDWVRKLYELSPKEIGLDKIYFYNVGENSENIGVERLNPKSDLIYEKVVTTLKKSNGLLIYEFAKALPTAAIWISIDGDDSKSTFKTTIKKISLESNP